MDLDVDCVHLTPF